MRKVKTYLDTLMDDEGFRGRFAHEYERLGALAAKEKGKEKQVTKKFIDNLKKSCKKALKSGKPEAVWKR